MSNIKLSRKQKDGDANWANDPQVRKAAEAVGDMFAYEPMTRTALIEGLLRAVDLKQPATRELALSILGDMSQAWLAAYGAEVVSMATREEVVGMRRIGVDRKDVHRALTKLQADTMRLRGT